MNKLEKLFGLGAEDSDADDRTELVDGTQVATELLATDRVGTGAFDPTDVASDDMALGFDETDVAPGGMYSRTAKTPRHSVPKAPILHTNLHPPPPNTYQGGWDDDDFYDDDDEDSFDQTDVAPIKVGDVSATMLGAAIDGRFKLHGILGEGGMGRVYRAEQISIGRPVAIKVIKKDLAQKDDVRKRFLREAKLISTFTHPNIVRLIDFGELDDGRLYLAMEFVNGVPLSDLFVGKQMHPRYALEMARQISSALIESHARGVIHRDLKPENIFLTRIADGSVQFKVLDFGVARTSASTLTAKGAVCGTPAYMAPEQARGLEVAGTTDLYSLGIMLFEALTGKLPFLHTDPFKLMLKQCQDPVPNVQDLAPHVPNDVAEVVTSLLSKKSSNRIGSSTQLCDTIEHLVQQNGWGGTVRIPAGPLVETTEEWIWTSASAAAEGMLLGQSDWLMGSHDRQSQNDKVPAGLVDREFDSIELDLPEPQSHTPPALQAVSLRSAHHTPDPYQDPPTAEVSRPTRMERRMTPAPTMERRRPSAQTHDRRMAPEPTLEKRAPSNRKKSSGNKGLVALLIGMLLVAVGLAGFVIYRSSAKTSEAESAYITGLATADGDAQEIFRHIQNLGWEITQPRGNNHAGITTFAARARKDKAVLKIAIDSYPSSDDAIVRYNSVLSGVYMIDTHVIAVEPDNAIAGEAQTKAILTGLQTKMPGGKLTL